MDMARYENNQIWTCRLETRPPQTHPLTVMNVKYSFPQTLKERMMHGWFSLQPVLSIVAEELVHEINTNPIQSEMGMRIEMETL